MIADTALAIYRFVTDEMRWFEDRSRVGRALDAVLDTPLGSLVRYAGLVKEATKAPTRAAVHNLVATGKDEVFSLQDAARPERTTVVLSIAYGALAVDARCYRAELSQRRTAIDDLATIGIALRTTGLFAGLAVGFVRPLLQSYATYEFDRVQPRAARRHSGMLRSGAILDLIDTRFHASNDEGADPGELRLANSDVPPWVRRSGQDGLVILRWTRDLADKTTLDRACEAHEDWLDRNLPAT